MTYKIVLINHSFQVRYFYRRWELFAQAHPDFEVTLLAPSEYEWYNGKSYSYDGAKLYLGKAYEKDNFRIRLFNTVYPKRGDWTSSDFKDIFCEINPDIIYNIGTHQQSSLIQIIKIVRKYLPNTKVACFSMRGPSHNLKLDLSSGNPLTKLRTFRAYLIQKYNLDFVLKNVDVIFCHYPDAMDCFRAEGYKGPIYMQTQVGVNTEWFHPDKEARKEIRDRHDISPETFVFGSATRFTKDKGVDDIVNALPLDGNWKYIMMGTGSEEDVKRLKHLVCSRGLEDKILMPGMIDWYEIAKYWNAVDCAIHVPRTTPHWVETFSLTAIQPQATMKPVIGNDSGSVPYQIGFDEMIVHEGDIEALNAKIKWVLDNKSKAAEYGKMMYERTLNSFSVQHLNDLFYRTLVEDVLQGKFDENKSDMTNVIK